MTTTTPDSPPNSSTIEPPSPAIALCVMQTRVTSETGVFNCEHAGFWFPDWQAGEREADEDIAAGRVSQFESVDEAIEHLRGIRE